MNKLAALALLVCVGAAQAATQAATPPADPVLDTTVQAAIERYDLPGIAVGVIEDGKVAYARGFGETVAGSGDPVTTDTLFKIASNSKAMTAAVLAQIGRAHV